MKAALCGKVLACRYNKPEGLAMYLQRSNLKPETIIFIDDNSDNCWNMFTHWATKFKSNEIKEQTQLKEVISIWYSPPKEGRDEKHNEIYRKLFEHFSNSK